MPFEPARTKTDATARMYRLAGRPVLPLGPGSKEKKSALEALGSVVGLDLESVATKHECGRQIAVAVAAVWDSDCFSTGDTITLAGLNRLLGGVVETVGPAREPDAPVVSSQARESFPDRGTDRPHAHQEETTLSTTIEDVQQSIAEHLAVLCQGGARPKGVSAAQGPIIPPDVSFEDGAWRDVVADVQDWLRISVDGRDRDLFTVSLASSLGLPEADAHDDAKVLPVLETRLERAVAFREAFLERLEDSSEGVATLETATQEWLAMWDSADEERANESSGPIYAIAETWPIQQFVQHASDEELNLSPSYQRADVWPNADAQLLIESVIRGIPLPSVILLQTEVDGLPSYEVVDGKQRLTSILRFTGHHPTALKHVRRKAGVWGISNLVETFQSNYPEFKKIWKERSATSLTAKLEREMYFPFPLRSGAVSTLSGDLAGTRGKYYSEIRDVVVKIVGEPRKLRHVFEQTSKYCIPVIVYKEATSEQVHEVFSLYNKQGKHLNAEEIRNALYHRLDLMRAILITAGDSDDVETVAPFLVGSWETLRRVGESLESYGFGKSGYKRSKVLAWVASIILYENGKPGSRSTASQINEFFKEVKDSPRHPLRASSTLARAMVALERGLDAHTTIDDEVWAPKFKNSLGGGKWQELQLIPTLVALTVGYLVHGDGLEDVVDEHLDDIRESSARWKRPSKTQSREQWAFTARVVREFLEILEVDIDAADQAIREEFGASGLSVLVSPASDEARV